ncbi:hypothetical protein PTSG_13109 [Salpingoeca rosetta]|uniref:Secreted protein n=1 Tax=Salpingoeca rosetta (strain ATCC 50818 / BSB-021) TaxID=946362 RepID=F2UR81_SALR5|nr:uncharacterized protein PTSG_13109 [Salpingoeca rosetta]EGD80184.1 hypothetical protein PTSG_13109 [Salpingoeca rosetta]|eukprot:XP_004988246.1 hypothetical protein PTSG_13109 [Salpingoeca rosetta]
MLTLMLLFTDISSTNTVGLIATADDNADGRLTQRRRKRRASSWHSPASLCPAHATLVWGNWGRHRQNDTPSKHP